jgi:thioredoxin 1
MLNCQNQYQSRYERSTATFLFVALVAVAISGCGGSADDRTATNPATTGVGRPGVPILLDLGATECIPCKKMAPILEELDTAYAGVLNVEFVNVWEAANKETAKSYGIEEIPTQIFLDPEGNELWRHVGFISKADILAKWSELGYELKPIDLVDH